MSVYSADSPNQTQRKPKKRSRDSIWDNFTEVNDLFEIKIRCNHCQRIVTKHKTLLTSHWEHRHKDTKQPARKIRGFEADGLTEPNENTRKFSQSWQRLPAISINSFLHPLMRRLFRVTSPSLEIPSSFATLKSLLLNQLGLVQAKVKNEVENLKQRFSLTCDVWTDSEMMNACLGVTIHYCDFLLTLLRICLFKSCISASSWMFCPRFEVSHHADLQEHCGQESRLPDNDQSDRQIQEVRECPPRESAHFTFKDPVLGRYLKIKEDMISAGNFSLTKIFVNILIRVQAEKTVTISCGYRYIKAIYRSLDKFEERTALGTASCLRSLLDKMDSNRIQTGRIPKLSLSQTSSECLGLRVLDLLSLWLGLKSEGTYLIPSQRLSISKIALRRGLAQVQLRDGIQEFMTEFKNSKEYLK